MKVSLKKLLYSLICWYPLLNISICYLYAGDNMVTFSVIYCCILLGIMFIRVMKYKIQTIFIIVCGLLTIMISFIREDMIYSTYSVLFVVTMLYLNFFSEIYFDIDDFSEYVRKKKEICFAPQVLFLMVLFYHYSLYGFKAGWSTAVLQGPYNYPHTLAYLLLLYAMLDAFLWINTQSKPGFILAGLNLLLLLLTAVRSALLAACFSILYLLLRFVTDKEIKKLLLFIGIGLLILIIAYKYGFLNGLIAKTELAIAHSSITNGRGNIALVSINTLMSDGRTVVDYFFGVGMGELLNNNYRYLGYAIHAHNDFIDVFVCYGIVDLGLYIYSFHKFAKKNRIWIWLCIGCLAVGNGLFMYIDAVPMLFFARLFFESISYNADSLIGKIYKVRGKSR